MKAVLPLEEDYIRLDDEDRRYLRDYDLPEETRNKIEEVLYRNGYYCSVHVGGTKNYSPNIGSFGFSPLVRYFYVAETIAKKRLPGSILEATNYVCMGPFHYWIGFSCNGEKIYVPYGHDPPEHDRMKICNETGLKKYLGKTKYPRPDENDIAIWEMIEENVIYEEGHYEIIDSKLLKGVFREDLLEFWVPNYQQLEETEDTGYPPPNNENWGCVPTSIADMIAYEIDIGNGTLLIIDISDIGSPGNKMRLEILAGHAFRAAKRIYGIPNFRYDALADGLNAIFNKAGAGLSFFQRLKPPPLSQPLF